MATRKENGKVVVFIGQQADVEPLLAAVSRQQEGVVILVAASIVLAEEVAYRGMACRSLDEYLELGHNEEIKKTATDWFDAWADQRVWNGRSYKEAVALEGVGAWWFILPVLIPDVLRCVQFVEGLLALIKKERPSSLWLVDVEKRKPYPLRLGLDANLPGKVAAMVCRAQGIGIRRIEPPLAHRVGWWAEYARARGGLALYYALVRCWVARWRAWLTRGDREGAESEKKGTIALVTSPVYWRQTIDLNGEKVIDDAIAGTCKDALGARGYRLLGIDVDLGTPNLKQFTVLRQKRARASIQWRAIEYYYRTAQKEKRVRRARLNTLWQEVGGDAVRRRGMLYRDIDFAPLLAGRFSYLFAHYLEEAMAYLDALENALEREKVDLVIIVYEEGPAGRAAIIAGQRQRVPTLALQHGTLSSPYTPAYYLSAVSTEALGDPASCPVPTATAVYGEHTRAMLVEMSTYPSESVVMVGMPAHDGIVRWLWTISRAESRSALGLAECVPMVLVVSQPFFNRENRDYFAAAVVEAATRMPHIQWAIKLHPSEGTGAWEQYLGTRAANMRVFSDDLHYLLSACDLVVSWYSTVILEAVLFARPVISIKIPGCLAPEDYLRDGLVVEAENSADIELQVNSLLQDDELRQRRLRQGAEALGKYVYRSDGLASERVADLVENMVQKGRIKRKEETH